MSKHPINADAVVLALMSRTDGVTTDQDGYLHGISFERDDIIVCQSWLEALVFEDAKAAFDFINQVNPLRPIGDNGLENKPAMRFRYTAFHLTQMHRWETSGQTFH